MRAHWMFGVLAWGALVACLDDEPCDPGQVYQDNVCLAESEPTSDGGAGGAGSDVLGAPCVDNVDHSDCAEPAPYCAIQPGEDGYCVAIVDEGCDNAGPEACPAGWECFRLGAVAPGEPDICIRQ